MTPISLIVPIMKVNYSEILTLNIDYYVQYAICLNQSTQNSHCKQEMNIWLTILNTNNGITNINPNIQLFV